MDFDFSELDPMGLGIGLIGGVISLVVTSRSPVGMVYKIGGFILSTIVCYIVGMRIINK